MTSVNNTKSVILNISLLEKEYNNTLTQYQQAYQNYIKDLTKSKQNKSTFQNLNGRTFWGSAEIKQFTTNDINVCKASCASLPSCSGATFDSSKKTCWLRSGDGEVMAGLKSNIAIIPSIIQSSNILKQLNSKLIDINTKIINLIKSSNVDYNKQYNTRNNLDKQLKKNYNNLIIENNRVNKLISETENLNELNNNSMIVINHYYLIYTVIIVIVIIFTIISLYRYIRKT
jgi:hypothetical protein